MRFWLPLVSGVVLLAGLIAVVVVFDVLGLRNTAHVAPTPLTSKPAQVYHKPKTVPLAKGVKETAGKFILTAVNRKDLRTAWSLVSPSMKQGFTLKKWLSGSIPVVPYPVVSLASYKVDESYPRSALLEVALLPGSKSKVKPQIFFIGLEKVGTGAKARWLVDYWAPRGRYAVPSTLNN